MIPDTIYPHELYLEVENIYETNKNEEKND
jgi:hypothetical protein